MEIKFLGTGSKGNCICIQTDSTTILIDIGLKKTKVEKQLIEAGIMPSDIDAIFLTHSHSDHVCGLPMAEKWNIPVYASAGTWKTIKAFNGDICVVESLIVYGHIKVGHFRTHHDDYESFGYTVDDGQTKVSICLDTGHVDDDMIKAMSGSDIYIIEANHDEETLINNEDRPDSVKARILSDVGHLSNAQTAQALSKLVQGKGEQIYLAHLSGANNSPVLAMSEVMKVLKVKGFKMNVDYTIGVV